MLKYDPTCTDVEELHRIIRHLLRKNKEISLCKAVRAYLDSNFVFVGDDNKTLSKEKFSGYQRLVDGIRLFAPGAVLTAEECNKRSGTPNANVMVKNQRKFERFMRKYGKNYVRKMEPKQVIKKYGFLD